jgi:hypothetical protein
LLGNHQERASNSAENFTSNNLETHMSFSKLFGVFSSRLSGVCFAKAMGGVKEVKAWRPMPLCSDDLKNLFSG